MSRYSGEIFKVGPHVPLDKEILAWNIDGKSWHQVHWDGQRWRMRWNPSFSQFFRDYSHWTHLPEAPK